MKIAGYLKEKQPILYRTFANALQNNTVTHSYLIVGEAGTRHCVPSPSVPRNNCIIC